jgi:hypothetical protein
MQSQLEFYWWGCPKRTAKLRHLIFTIQSNILSTGGDALRTSPSGAQHVTLQEYFSHPSLIILVTGLVWQQGA